MKSCWSGVAQALLEIAVGVCGWTKVCAGLPSARLQHRTRLTKGAQEADVRSCLRESAPVYNKLLKVHEELLVGRRSGITRDCSG